MADDDRVHMTATAVFHNPLIAPDKPRADAHTVQDGDGFSTSELHARELEAQGFAERSEGEAAPMSDAAKRLLGAQTSSGGAVQSNRVTRNTVGQTAPPATAAAAPPATAAPAKPA